MTELEKLEQQLRDAASGGIVHVETAILLLRLAYVQGSLDAVRETTERLRSMPVDKLTENEHE